MLQAIHIRKQFQRSGEVLRDVSFTLGDGEFLSVIGPSGAGKTTLFRILNGTELCSGGEVLYGGTHFEAARGREKRALQQGIGTIYQDFCLVENLSAIQNVLNACLPDMSLAASLLGAFGRERSEQAAAILREVGLADKLEEPVKNLSGGQKQRVAIAGIIAMETKCIVLDEPTAMLDPRGRTEVMETIQRLNREKGITIVLITHYMDEAVQAGRVVVMDEGNVLRDGTPREVFSDVEFLKRHDLDVPQATELAYRLSAAGIKLPEMPLSVEESVKMFRRYLRMETH